MLFRLKHVLEREDKLRDISWIAFQDACDTLERLDLKFVFPLYFLFICRFSIKWAVVSKRYFFWMTWALYSWLSFAKATSISFPTSTSISTTLSGYCSFSAVPSSLAASPAILIEFIFSGKRTGFTSSPTLSSSPLRILSSDSTFFSIV